MNNVKEDDGLSTPVAEEASIDIGCEEESSTLVNDSHNVQSESIPEEALEVVDADVHSESISTSVDENQDNQCTEVADNNHTTEINVCDDAIVDMTDQFATSLCSAEMSSSHAPDLVLSIL